MGFNNARKITEYTTQGNQTDAYLKSVLCSITGQLSKAGKITSVEYPYSEEGSLNGCSLLCHLL